MATGLCLVCLEHDARVVATKAKAVRQRHLDLVLLLLACNDCDRVHAILRVIQVDGGVDPACSRAQFSIL